MAKRCLRRAVFVDRDGTIIVDKNYLSDPDEVELIPGAVEALKIFNSLSFLVVVVSNQSGVARGFYSIDDVERVNRHIRLLFEREGAYIDKFYYCPHYSGGVIAEYSYECDCRKPRAGMLLRASSELEIELSRSFVVGDKDADILLGRAVGATCILVLTGQGSLATQKPDFVAKDILEAARWIKKRAYNPASETTRQ